MFSSIKGNLIGELEKKRKWRKKISSKKKNTLRKKVFYIKKLFNNSI